jgi:cell division initiation protein
MARKKDEGSPGSGTRLTPVDVQQIQFRRALRGYDEQEVDDFLDRITEELTLLIEERRSATDRAGSLPTVRVSSAGAAAATQQAEELVAQARERAEAIVREAQQRAAEIIRQAGVRAAAGGGAVAAGSGAAIALYVSREREFLQQLASLVQGHAESVKGMVAQARDSGASGAGGGGRSAAAGGAVGGGSTSGAPSGGGGASSGSASSAVSASRTDPAGGSPGRPEPGSPQASSDGGVVSVPTLETTPQAGSGSPGRTALVTEPRAADVAGTGSAEPRPVAESDADDSSLRELFWGED